MGASWSHPSSFSFSSSSVVNTGDDAVIIASGGSISNSEGSVKINDHVYRGRSIQINNNEVIVDGVVVSNSSYPQENRHIRTVFTPITIHVTGDADQVTTSNGIIHVQGNANHVKSTNGSIEIGNSVSGSISTTNGNVSAKHITGPTSTVNGRIRCST
ncbi:MAG: hypothetical protein Sylvanvirus2_19 [Sylvanvirus sp.]|uniref:Uncharacterized protein n=1 Tax=Sylvanvirus sp. TaxID=2487774 RepID=A0A3G5AK49_9VIRU|nr:MAG: hypothetical protein Sylvanvirus2_19 [Sylvanvirus sp.]